MVQYLYNWLKHGAIFKATFREFQKGQPRNYFYEGGRDKSCV